MRSKIWRENAGGRQKRKWSRSMVLAGVLMVAMVAAVTVEVRWPAALHVSSPSGLFLRQESHIQSQITEDGKSEKKVITSIDSREMMEEMKKGRKEEEEPLPVTGYTFPNCDCVRFGVDLKQLQQQEERRSVSGDGIGGGGGGGDWLKRWFNLTGPSTCSDFATQRGGGQRVVAYSYYNTDATTSKASIHYKKYLAPLHKRARRIAKVYPGYLMRVYHNVTAEDTTATAFLCTLICTHAHLDLCDVTRLPGLGNLVQRGVVGRAWRFAVLGDPTIDHFLSRDSDSWVLDREVDAVKEWLAGNQTFHVMRDHPHHRAVILAGLWGGRNKWPERLTAIRDTIFDQPTNLNKFSDQQMLAEHLWPKIQNDTLQHDSFTCLHPTHQGAQPYPSRREGSLYCGCGPYKTREMWHVSRTKCPKECRPPAHRSWTHC